MPITDFFRRTAKSQWFRQLIKLVLDGQMGALGWLVVFDLIQGEAIITIDIIDWVILVVVVSALFRLTRIHYRMIGIKDFFEIVMAGITLFLFSIVIILVIGRQHSGRVYLFLFLTSMFTGIFWTTLRIIARSIYEGFFPFLPSILSPTAVGSRTLIVGAGRAGLLVSRELDRHPELGCNVIGYVDDAFEKQGLRIQGIPVLGTTDLLDFIIKEQRISKVVIAIPSAPGKTIRQLSNVIRGAGIETKTVPGFYNLLGNQSWKPDLRDISIEDLLRRDPIHLDQTALQRVLGDAVVLITGAGGSIGSELARQVAVFKPARIVLLGRGENSLWIVERELREISPNLPLAIELCDIRDATRLRQIFLRWRPQVVFHAAAHKHVPYLELNPEEAIENNVFGTQSVLEAALAVQTQVFVNISTDKSVNPTNALGVSKCLAEGVVRCGATRARPGSQYVSVRFGNVLGSRGSVVPVFRDQISRGGPVTITDARMTRYFMTIPEASQLVLQAGLLGETGKVYVLDMGEPVAILDLAKDMITLSGMVPERDIEIQTTGIRPGEKLFEELFNMAEISQTKVHSKVLESPLVGDTSAQVEAGLVALRGALSIEDERARRSELVAQFQALVPSYVPSALGLGKYCVHHNPKDAL